MSIQEKLGAIGSISANNDAEQINLDLNMHPHQEGVFINNVSEVEIMHGSVRVNGTEVHYKGYFPEIRTEQGLGIMVPGYGGFYKSSEPIGQALAGQGLANIIYDPARTDNSSMLNDFKNPQKLHVDTIRAISSSVRRNKTIKNWMPDGNNASQEDRLIVTHSMGGLSGAKYAHENPEETEIIFFLKAAGFGGPTLSQLAKSVPSGIIGSIQHEIIPYLRSGDIEINKQNLSRVLHYFGFGKNARITRPMGEGLSCLWEDVREITKNLGQLGVKSVYIDAERDILVHPAPGIENIVDKYIVLKKYGHMAPQRKALHVAQLILKTRSELV